MTLPVPVLDIINVVTVPVFAVVTIVVTPGPAPRRTTYAFIEIVGLTVYVPAGNKTAYPAGQAVIAA
jgi:hypothetical protein